MDPELTNSFLIGLVVAIVTGLVALTYLSAITGVAGSWITWYGDIKYLRSLPCPPRHWLWGHALKVSSYIKTIRGYVG